MWQIKLARRDRIGTYVISFR